MNDPPRCSRRRAIALLAAAAVPLWLGRAFSRPELGLDAAATGALDIATIVVLHLEHLERCGPACAARAARIRPGLLAAARRCEATSGVGAVHAAFALVGAFDEFPPVQRSTGGWQ